MTEGNNLPLFIQNSEYSFDLKDINQHDLSDCFDCYDNRRIYPSVDLNFEEGYIGRALDDEEPCRIYPDFNSKINESEIDEKELDIVRSDSLQSDNKKNITKTICEEEKCFKNANSLRIVYEVDNDNFKSSRSEKEQTSKYYSFRDFSNADPNSQKYVRKENSRWSKQEDIKLFSVYKIVLARFRLDQSEIDLSKGKIKKGFRRFFKVLKTQSEWRGTLIELKSRINKITSATKFTDRDIRVLKRFLRKEADGLVTMEQVLEQFPGKTLAQIYQFKREYIKDI